MATRAGQVRSLPRLRQQRLPRRRSDVHHRLLDPVLLHHVLRAHAPREAGIIFVVARLLDAFFSPVIGYISDHFHRTWLGKKFGRRRFFILLAIPLVPSFALMWVEGQSFWYYLITYCFFELVYAMEIIPYETLAAEMSPDYKTKAKFAGARIICGQIANIAAMWLPGVIIALPRRQGIGATPSCISASCSRCSSCSWRWRSICSPGSGRSSEIPAADLGPMKSPFTNLTQLFEDLGRHAAHPRVPAASRHVPRRLHQPGHPERRVVVHHRVRVPGLGRHRFARSPPGWRSRSCSRWSSTIWLALRIHAAPSYRIALGLFAIGIIGIATLYVVGRARSRAGTWLVRARRRPRPRRAQLHSVERLQLHAGRRRNRHGPAARRRVRRRHDLRAQAHAVGRHLHRQPDPQLRGPGAEREDPARRSREHGGHDHGGRRTRAHGVRLHRVAALQAQPRHARGAHGRRSIASRRRRAPTADAREPRHRRRSVGLEIRRALGTGRASSGQASSATAPGRPTSCAGSRDRRAPPGRRRTTSCRNGSPASRCSAEARRRARWLRRPATIGVHGVVDELRRHGIRRLRAGSDPR